MKVAILGYGVEGKSAEKYFLKHGDKTEVFEGDFSEMNFDDFDLVMRSPSVRPTGDWSSGTKFFFEKCPCPIVGVTATKGKGTTCSLIASIFEKAGKKTWLIGNIGVPALDVLDDISEEDAVVYELSSFQLWDMKRSPHVAVVGHFEPDHLDIHTDMEEYLGAKANITKWQEDGDFVVFYKNDTEATKIAEHSKGEKISYPTGDYEEVLDSIKLPGNHNRLNGEAAILAIKCMGVDDEKVWAKGLASFEGLPHRTKFVREVDGVSFYDNSIATVPGSTIMDIKAFREPKILILGGAPKGADFGELAKAIKSEGVEGVVLMGPEGERIKTALDKNGYKNYKDLGHGYSMDGVVKAASEMAKPGTVVILSPAATSFDRFKNYAERGDEFIRAVEAL